MQLSSGGHQTSSGGSNGNNAALPMMLLVVVIVLAAAIIGAAIIMSGRPKSALVPAESWKLVVYFDVSGSVTSLNASEKRVLKGLTDEVITPAVDAGADVMCLAFSNETSTRNLRLFYDAAPKDPDDPWGDIERQVFDGGPRYERGTLFSTVLAHCLEQAQGLGEDERYFAVMISDGGVDTEDWSACRKVARQLKACKSFGGLLILPIEQPRLRQQLTSYVLAEMGTKLVTGSGADTEDALAKFAKLHDQRGR